MDWYDWHERYNGSLGSRLHAVQGQIDAALAAAGDRPIRVISLCAGQGHDIVGSLQRFDRRADVEALLVELDERNVAAARRRIADASLSGVAVVQGDAGVTDAYVGMAPADIVLVCGVFGSLTDEDIDTTISLLPTLLSPSGQVIWTAHRAAPGLWDTASESFERHGFRELWTNDVADPFGVGRHVLATTVRPLEPGQRMFTFADEQTLVGLGRA